MTTKHATQVLRRLEQRHVAPRGEHAIDLEQAAVAGGVDPEPVLLLTDAALYARTASAKDWSRLPLDRIRRVSVSTDPSGMVTRYRVEDDADHVRCDLALPLARASFRERMQGLQLAPESPAVAELAVAEIEAEAGPLVRTCSTGWPALVA